MNESVEESHRESIKLAQRVRTNIILQGNNTKTLQNNLSTNVLPPDDEISRSPSKKNCERIHLVQSSRSTILKSQALSSITASTGSKLVKTKGCVEWGVEQF